MVVLPLQYACMPYLPQMFLKLSAMPCVQRMTTHHMLGFCLVDGFICVCVWIVAVLCSIGAVPAML